MPTNPDRRQLAIEALAKELFLAFVRKLLDETRDPSGQPWVVVQGFRRVILPHKNNKSACPLGCDDCATYYDPAMPLPCKEDK